MNLNIMMWGIKRKGGRLFSFIHKIAQEVLTFSIPINSITKPFFLMLYNIHIFLREFLSLILKVFYYEPLFRARCEKVGRNLRMEKLPYITGHGKIIIGDNVYLSGKSGFSVGGKVYSQPELIIGNNTFIGHGCSIEINQKVLIGNNCLIAGGVMIFDSDGHPHDFRKRRENLPVDKEDIKPVIIEDDVWICAKAIILKGVRVGARSIIGAGAVVTHDIPPDTLFAGNPARIIKEQSYKF